MRGDLHAFDATTGVLYVLADVADVRMWREDGVLLMRGRTRAYAVEPRGEYVVGVIEAGHMSATRGRERYEFRAGDVCVWDASAPHRGSGDWTAWLAVLEDPGPLDGLEFPDPVGRTEPTGTLIEWLHDLAGPRPPLTRDDPALQRARDYLGDRLPDRVTLDELAAAAGTDKFRIVRLFRAATGMPPHRYQLAQRIRLARRMLERGVPIAEVAAATGFVDQSHLHRHFRRTLGMTPASYARLTAQTYKTSGLT
jgi:AraC-like DNA-binding protein